MNYKIAAVLALTATKAYADKCYALAFSSGDQSSAYQAGVLKGLIQAHGASETAYSAVSGVSGGGVNAALLGSFTVGQETSAAERMITFWQNTTTNKLYKDWIGGIVEGLTVKPGLYNDALLQTFL
jgi:predicted acylesterase/phospholipase RssA